MAGLTAFVRRKWQWACEKPYAWASVALASGTVAVVFVWPGPSDTRLRLWALGLQLIGAWTVWHDLTSAASGYGYRGVLHATVVWLRRGLTPGDMTARMSGSATFGISATARMRGRQPREADQSIEQRIDRLERNQELIDDELTSAFREIDRRDRESQARSKEETRQREVAIRRIEDKIRDNAIGNFPILLFGAAWLTIGTVLSALAPEIVRMVAGQWAAVWQAL